MKVTNYHNESAEFTVGQTVTHVTDEGAMVEATIIGIESDALRLAFADGDEGTELPATCF